MFKLVVLSCIVSVAFGGVIHTPVVKQYVENHQSIIETPTVSHVGTKLSNIPTGVSHHSSSVVHDYAQFSEPIYAHGVQKTVVQTPVVKKIVEHVPAVQPVYHEPIVASKIVSQPIVQAYAAPSVYSHAAPAVYAQSYAPVAKYIQEPVYAKTIVQAPIAYSSVALPAAHASYAHHW